MAFFVHKTGETSLCDPACKGKLRRLALGRVAPGLEPAEPVIRLTRGGSWKCWIKNPHLAGLATRPACDGDLRLSGAVRDIWAAAGCLHVRSPTVLNADLKPLGSLLMAFGGGQAGRTPSERTRRAAKSLKEIIIQ